MVEHFLRHNLLYIAVLAELLWADSSQVCISSTCLSSVQIEDDASLLQLPKTKTASLDLDCGSCKQCMLSNGVCYEDVAEDACTQWSESKWCGEDLITNSEDSSTSSTTLTISSANSGSTHATNISSTIEQNIDYLTGGWCQAAWSNKCTWGNSANAIFPGGFQADPSVKPNPSNWAKTDGSSYKAVWLATGGENVGSPGQSPCFDASWILQTVQDVGATGVSFDMEGCYHGMLDKVLSTINEMKKARPDLDYVYTPLGDGEPTPYFDVKDFFTFASPMFYWGATTYETVTCATVKSWISNWVEAGWPNSRLIITFQSQAASSPKGQEVLSCLADEVQSKGYAGLVGWPYQSTEDQANLHQVQSTLR